MSLPYALFRLLDDLATVKGTLQALDHLRHNFRSLTCNLYAFAAIQPCRFGIDVDDGHAAFDGGRNEQGGKGGLQRPMISRASSFPERVKTVSYL